MSSKPSPAMQRALAAAAQLGAAATADEVAKTARVPYRLALIAVRNNLSARR